MQADGVRPSDLERIVVGVGPGGFTGLRIGIASALGLAQALQIPCVGASSLEALAMSIAEAAPTTVDVVVPVLDARRGEVFAAAYGVQRGSGLEELIAPAALAPDVLETRVLAIGGARPVVGGSGLAALAGALQGEQVLGDGPLSSPRAANLVTLAAAGRSLPVAPVYARLPDAQRKRQERET